MIFKMLFSQQLCMHCSQWLLWENITLRFLNSFVLILEVTVFNLMILNHFVGKQHFCQNFWDTWKSETRVLLFIDITLNTLPGLLPSLVLQRTPLGHHVISNLNSCIGIMSTTFYVMFQIFYQSRINKNFSQPKFDS